MQRNIIYLLCSLMIVSIFWWASKPVYSCKLSYGDDYRILTMLEPANVFAEYKASCNGKELNLKGSISFDNEIGRCRPLSWTYLKIQTLLFGEYIPVYRLSGLLVLLLSIYFLFLLLKQFKLSFLPSLTGVLIYVFGIHCETWWSLIPPAQNIGELFLISGTYLLHRGINENKKKILLLSISILLLSSLVKESIAAVVPFIILYFKQTNIRHSHLLRNAMILSVLPLFYILFISFMNGSYGYESASNITSTVTNNIKFFITDAVFLIAPLMCLFFLKPKPKSLLIVVSILALQLLLLFKIKIDQQHHYLSPGIIVISVVTAISLNYFKIKQLLVFKLLFAIYILATLYNIKNLYINTNYYATKINTFHTMFDELINLQKSKQFIFVSQAPAENDLLRGFSVHLKNRDPQAILFKLTSDSKSPQFFKLHPDLTSNGNKYLIFELPDEKGQIPFPAYQVGDSVKTVINNIPYTFKAKLLNFTSEYNNLGWRDILHGNFTRTEKLNYKALLLN